MNTQMQLLAEVKGAVVPLTEVGNHSGAAPLPRKFHAACSLYPWRPLFVVFGGWRTGPHFEDLHMAALGADAKALDVYKRSPVAADVDDLEDGFLEIRVFVPELGTTETLRTSRRRLRFLVETGVFGAPTTAGGDYRFLRAGARAADDAARRPAGDVDARGEMSRPHRHPRGWGGRSAHRRHLAAAEHALRELRADAAARAGPIRR